MEQNTDIPTASAGSNVINKSSKSYRDGMVHLILSHSYMVFLLAVVFGLILDIIMPVDLFSGYVYGYTGFIMIVLGSILIYWSQATSSSSKKEMDTKGTPRNFAVGPYKYSRNPTHIGLTIMMLGLALVLNSLFSIILTVVVSLLTKAIFLKKEEAFLLEKYGEPYQEYKNKVGSWL